MKYIKLFENFGISAQLTNALRTIVDHYKEEDEGAIVHPSEDFGEGEILIELSNETNDDRISSILKDYAKLCEYECDGSAEHVCDWINDDDCDYIEQFLGSK